MSTPIDPTYPESVEFAIMFIEVVTLLICKVWLINYPTSEPHEADELVVFKVPSRVQLVIAVVL